MMKNNVYQLPNANKKASPKIPRLGFLKTLLAIGISPLAIVYVLFKQGMCNHEMITVGATYLQNGLKIKILTCNKCRKIQQAY